MKHALLSLVALALTVTVAQADSLNCRLVGHCTTPDAAYGVAVSGGYAYVADAYSGLRVIDVTNPQSPSEAGYCRTPTHALGVAVAGSYAYVADMDTGLRIIDVANPQSPAEAGHCVTPHYAQGVAVAGNYAYVANYTYGGLRIIDVSNPQSPTEAGYYDTPGAAQGVAVLGNYAYVADYDSGLRVIDVTNPHGPTEAGHCATPASAMGVTVSGNYAYVADAESGLRVIDVANHQSPTEVGHCETDLAYGVAVPGMQSSSDGHSYAYVAAGISLRVIDVTNPQSPTESGYYQMQSRANGVAVAGAYAYMADDYGGLQIIEFRGAGVAETPHAVRHTPQTRPTLVRGILKLPLASSVQREASSVLLDISGRKVLDLRSGPNDVSRVAPGIYFVVVRGAVAAQWGIARKVVIP